jgi:hypothetical protein
MRDKALEHSKPFNLSTLKLFNSSTSQPFNASTFSKPLFRCAASCLKSQAPETAPNSPPHPTRGFPAQGGFKLVGLQR